MNNLRMINDFLEPFDKKCPVQNNFRIRLICFSILIVLKNICSQIATYCTFNRACKLFCQQLRANISRTLQYCILNNYLIEMLKIEDGPGCRLIIYTMQFCKMYNVHCTFLNHLKLDWVVPTPIFEHWQKNCFFSQSLG